jgi:hypothetical protein
MLPGKTPLLLLAVAFAVLSVGGFLVTLQRSPVAWSDGIIYASIARSVQFDRRGVPTVLRDAPAAVDHVPFYGPVFFRVVAWMFAVAGFSDGSIRLVSLGGALMIALGGAFLVRALGGSREQQAWAAALLLLSPELGRGATDGRMDTLAVGFEVLALALFAGGLERERGAWLHGAAAGLLIAAAALTTPRTYPFVGAFLLGTALPIPGSGSRHGAVLRQMAACAATVALVTGSWMVAGHGSPARWFGYMKYIATHEGVDLAVLTPARDWSFTAWAAITPLAIAAAPWLARQFPGRHRGRPRDATRLFLWFAAGLNVAAGVVLFNFTFFFAIYIFIPLLAVAFASTAALRVPARTAVALLAVLVAADVAVRTGRYVRLASVWRGTDPESIERFVRAHVPAGSDVLGEERFYFFAVERAGAHYLFASPLNSPDWSRRVIAFDPAAGVPPGATDRAPAARFLIWPADEAQYPLPQNLACAHERVVAVFDPSTPRPRRLGPIPIDPRLPLVYPKTVLYGLPLKRADTMAPCPASS